MAGPPYRAPAPGVDDATGKRRPAPTLWQRATYRWTAITAVMAALLVVYTQHPYYQNNQFAPWRPLFTGAFCAWLVLGVFYVRATLKRFHGTRYAMRDGGLHLLLLAKAFQERRFWRLAKKPRIRTTLLAIGVKAFFTPLMTGFFAGHMNSIASAWMRRKGLPPFKIEVPKGLNPFDQAATWWMQVKLRLPDLVPSFSDVGGLLSPWTWSRAELSWGLGFAYDTIFFIDCGWALMGYASESRWLGNKTRSVEPTAFGWLVCLLCYPPFNNVLGTYLPLQAGIQKITGETALLVLRAITVLLFAIYAAATVSFGFKFSNLTHRGIVTRGPYRFVRHPAYLCKCTAWWLEHIPTITPAKALFLSLLCGVYALRAWTEERHLSRDPEYVAYKKKVRWVLLPGVY
jgi:protein-S-isoprenylcysteine O-methyltransferase Ste14